MHLLTTVMMAFWIWEYAKHHLYRIPDLLIHAGIVPAVSYVSWITPDQWRSVLAATGGVLLLHTLAGSSLRTSPKKRIKSNLPPLP